MSDSNNPENEVSDEAQAQQANAAAIEVEYDRLLDVLIVQMEREEFLAARATVEALLLLKPSEGLLMETTAFLEAQKPETPESTKASDEGRGASSE